MLKFLTARITRPRAYVVVGRATTPLGEWTAVRYHGDDAARTYWYPESRLPAEAGGEH